MLLSLQKPFHTKDETGEIVPLPPKNTSIENVLKREIGRYFGSDDRKPVFVSIVIALGTRVSGL